MCRNTPSNALPSNSKTSSDAVGSNSLNKTCYANIKMKLAKLSNRSERLSGERTGGVGTGRSQIRLTRQVAAEERRQ